MVDGPERMNCYKYLYMFLTEFLLVENSVVVLKVTAPLSLKVKFHWISFVVLASVYDLGSLR